MTYFWGHINYIADDEAMSHLHMYSQYLQATCCIHILDNVLKILENSDESRNILTKNVKHLKGIFSGN